MAYTPYYSGGWQSGSEGGTPITPAALNNMEAGITLANTLINSTSVGSYANIETAAAAVWDAMTDGTVRVGRFIASSLPYAFVAYRNSANYATLFCFSYSAVAKQVNKVNGAVTTTTYATTA